MIFDSNVDLDRIDNMFSMLDWSLDNYVSLGYFRDCDPSIDPYCIFLGDS